MSLGKTLVGLLPKGFRRFIRQTTPPIIWYWLRDRVEGVPDRPEALPARTGKALALESKLWGGFSGRALRELEELRNHPASALADVAEAARVLACWHASHGDPREAHHNALIMRLAKPKTARTDLQVLLEADSLSTIGEPTQARVLLEAALTGAPSRPSFQFALANTYAKPDGIVDEESEHRRLELINEVFRAAGVAPLVKKDDAKPIALENLTAKAPPARDDERVKISVLIPAYHAAKTLKQTLDSLLAQTWSNIEVIVVDDVSPDNTFEVASEYAARDPRVIAIRQTDNRGAYVARNTALLHATGDYVTVHDADDWSHPQKLERQVEHLLANPDVVANMTDWIRCLPHLYFRGRARANLSWIHFNHSSLMMKRDLLMKLGGWDEVRIAADSELIRRLEHGWIEGKVPRVLQGVPMAFALVMPTSLTQAGVTHARTLRHGVRRTYQEASIHWLKSRARKDVALTSQVLSRSSMSPPLPQGDSRCFPATGFIRPKKLLEESVDVLVIHDFLVDDELDRRTLSELKQAIAAGARVGLFQWHHYDSDVTSIIPKDVLQLAQEGHLYVVTPGEHIAAKSVLCRQAELFLDTLDLAPKIRSPRLLLGDSLTTIEEQKRAETKLEVERIARDDFRLPFEWVSADEPFPSP